MAIDQEADQPIALAMPIAFQRGKQPGHFILGQVLADPIGRVRLAPSRCDWSHFMLLTSLRRGDFMGLPTVFNGVTGRNIAYNATSLCKSGGGRFLAPSRQQRVSSPHVAALPERRRRCARSPPRHKRANGTARRGPMRYGAKTAPAASESPAQGRQFYAVMSRLSKDAAKSIGRAFFAS